MHLAAIIATDIAISSLLLWFAHRFEVSVHAREAAQRVFTADPDRLDRVLGADSEPLNFHDRASNSGSTLVASVNQVREIGR